MVLSDPLNHRFQIEVNAIDLGMLKTIFWPASERSVQTLKTQLVLPANLKINGPISCWLGGKYICCVLNFDKQKNKRDWLQKLVTLFANYKQTKIIAGQLPKYECITEDESLMHHISLWK